MQIGRRTFNWGTRTYLMGIINVTPDSFSGDGLDRDLQRIVRRARLLEDTGADLIDVGGESTRPGHLAVALEEELARVVPAIAAIASEVAVPISVDTRKAAVARAAVAAGAVLVNDVSGLRSDRYMAGTVGELGVPVVLLANGRCEGSDVVARVRTDLLESVALARAGGILAERLLIDPGFGFGKAWTENLALLSRLSELRSLKLPLLVGLSRKSTIARVLAVERGDSIAANAALAALSIAGGADVLRVHDVAEQRDAARLADAVLRRAATFAFDVPTGPVAS